MRRFIDEKCADRNNAAWSEKYFCPPDISANTIAWMFDQRPWNQVIAAALRFIEAMWAGRTMSGQLSNEDRERIAHYRKMAVSAAEGASSAATPDIRETYLYLARSWTALAQSVERFASDITNDAYPDLRG